MRVLLVHTIGPDRICERVKAGEPMRLHLTVAFRLLIGLIHPKEKGVIRAVVCKSLCWWLESTI
jgi:hypothetical protein